MRKSYITTNLRPLQRIPKPKSHLQLVYIGNVQRAAEGRLIPRTMDSDSYSR